MPDKSKQRLFEMMNRVGGMPLSENQSDSLPPGFSKNDFMSLDDFVDAELNEDTTGVGMQPTDPAELIGKKKSGDRSREEPYIHNKLITKITDMNGKEYNLDQLRREITQRPNTIIQTNTKVGKNGILKISLPAYRGLFYDESDQQFKIVNTCPNAGSCKNFCFAQKGGYVIWDNSSLSSTRILNFLLNHWDAYRYKVIDEIEKERLINEKRGGLTIIRWHDSGDFLSDKYLDLAMDIARETPDTLHYAYTKMVARGKAANVPDNFILRYSVDVDAPENDLIDKAKDKHADIIPKSLLKDLIHKNKKGKNDAWVYNSADAVKTAKSRIAEKFGLDPNTIITYGEMLKMPEEGVNKWNVINLPTDGDISATRNDVLGVYLLFH